MRPTRKTVKRLSLAVGAVAILIAAALAPTLYRWLWIEWHARQYLAELREHAGPTGLRDSSSPMPVRDEIIAAGKQGFPVISRVLQRTDKGPVLVGVWESLAQTEDDEYWNELWQYIRDADAETFLRFFILRTRDEGFFSLESAEQDTLGTRFSHADYWPDHWYSPGASRLQPSPSAVDFCRAVLRGDVLLGLESGSHTYYRIRAIGALTAMLPRRDLPPANEASDQLGSRILALLSRLAREGTDSQLAFETLWRLIYRAESSFSGNVMLQVESWWCYTHLGWRNHPAMLGEAGKFHAIDAAPVLGLLHLDRVETFDVLVELYEDPESREVIDAIIRDQNPSLPFPPPKWFPFHEAAARFLSRTPRERLYAARLLAEIGDTAAVPVLERALEAETNEDLRIIYKGALSSLGEREHLEAVRKALARLPIADAAHGASRAEGLNGVEAVHALWNPPSWSATRNRVELHPRDLAEFLIRSGDRDTLEEVMEATLARPGADPAMPLDKVFAPWPFGRKFDDYRMVWVGLRDGKLQITPLPLDSKELHEMYPSRDLLKLNLERELLASYWRALGPTMQWNDESRRFVADPQAFAGWVEEELSHHDVPVSTLFYSIDAMPPGRQIELARNLAWSLTDYYPRSPVHEDLPDELGKSYYYPSYGVAEDPMIGLSEVGELASWPWRGDAGMLHIRSGTTSVKLDDRQGCLSALLELSMRFPGAVSAPLAEALRSPERDLRLLAVVAHRWILREANEALPLLVERLDDEEWIIAREAARTIGALQSPPGVVSSILSGVVNDSKRHPAVRGVAARALADLGDAAGDVAPLLGSVATDRSTPAIVRAQAARAVWKIDRSEDMIPVLTEVLRGDETVARTLAAAALGEIGASASEALPALYAVLEEPEPEDGVTAQVHIEAAAAILSIAPYHADARRAVRALLPYARIGSTAESPPCPNGGALRALRVLEKYRRATGNGPPPDTGETTAEEELGPPLRGTEEAMFDTRPK